MRMHNPPHPGAVLKELCIEPLNLTVTEVAKALRVSRKTLSAILNGRAGISPAMAIRLGKAFNTSPESWLNQQMQYDLWQAQQASGNIEVKDLVPQGIDREQAAILRENLATFADDWNSPEMDIYDDYDAAKAAPQTR